VPLEVAAGHAVAAAAAANGAAGEVAGGASPAQSASLTAVKSTMLQPSNGTRAYYVSASCSDRRIHAPEESCIPVPVLGTSYTIKLVCMLLHDKASRINVIRTLDAFNTHWKHCVSSKPKLHSACFWVRACICCFKPSRAEYHRWYDVITVLCIARRNICRGPCTCYAHMAWRGATSATGMGRAYAHGVYTIWFMHTVKYHAISNTGLSAPLTW
jgi:hypothetical protein